MSDEPLPSGLYIVATPIGNLGDISLRSIDTLRRCDVIACEDTRVTGKLLKHLSMSKSMRRYDDHANDKAREGLLDLARTQAVALVSDAGTPLISDPGYQLVHTARAENIPVTATPGASAAIMALTISGLPSDRFQFVGFVPPKDAARAKFFNELSDYPGSTITYETGPRLLKSLRIAGEVLGDRLLVVLRELTKLHEDFQSGTAEELLAHFEAHPPKGEIVLLVAPAPEQAVSDHDLDALLIEALKTNKTSQAAAEVARQTGADRKLLYARAMELKTL